MTDRAGRVASRGALRLSSTRGGADPSGIRAGSLLALPLAATFAFLLAPIVLLGVRAVSGVGIGGFGTIVADPVFLDATGRTFLLAVVVTAACVLIGTLYAVALVVLPRVWSRILMAALLSAFGVSLLVRTFGWVILFQPNGALDQALAAIGLPTTGSGLLQTTAAMYPAMIHVLLPYVVLPVYAAATQLDHEQLRAAQSLGARPWTVLGRVVLPHLRPSVIAGGSLVFLLALAFYVTPRLLGGPSQLTLATLIDRQFNERFDLGGSAAMGLLLLAVVLIVYSVVSRFIDIVPKARS